MRYVNGLFCLILVLFTAVQYNDSDATLWILAYGVSAVWCGIAAFRPSLLAANTTLQALLGVCLLATLVATFMMWPTGQAWWTKQVIWDNELVREGMGLGIMAIALLAVTVTWWQRKSAS